MKRIIAIIFIVCFLLSGCDGGFNKSEEEAQPINYENMQGKLTGGVWLSFTELRNILSSENGFESEVKDIVDNCQRLGISNIYVHIRSHCDSVFRSDYFPLIAEAQNYSYDIFEYMINAFHSGGIRVHAWINPYRVSTASADIKSVREDSPIHKWLNDDNTENDKNVCIYNGVYLNPASEEVRQLVINGVREVATKYQVDGIHFDDYFYPTVDEVFDALSYEEYKKSAKKPLTLNDWRRANVNLLISSCYSAIKFIDKDIEFSISPAASIENNYAELYADVKAWVKGGYVDTIIPQLYFGFRYPDINFQFEKLLKDWKELMNSNGEVKLVIGLASYKIGTDSAPDSEEWQNDTDIIARQVKCCLEDDRIMGYALFSYSSLVSDEELNTKQRQNLEKLNEGV